MNQLGIGSAGDRTFDVGAVAEAISTDDIDVPLYQIESLCMRCHENGTTRILFTKIPHFRKILLSAFECPHCGERNNEVQFGGKLKFPGRSYKLQISSGDLKMLNRQVVKSDSATIKIPEIDFEIPPEAQRGSLSTVEGILTRAADELLALQEERRRVDPQTAEAIDKFLLKLKACATGELSFTLLLDDPAGNSFIENPFAPSPDPSLTVTLYERTPEQLASLGYQSGMPPLAEPQSESDIDNPSVQSSEPWVLAGATSDDHLSRECHSLEIDEARICYSAPEEVDTFPSTCGLCATSFESFGTHTFTRSKPKQKLKRYNGLFSVKSHCCQKVIVMASSCDSCGYRNSELKPGGRIPDKGKRITLSVRNANDLSRDVIKSDTAIVKVPELDFSGTFGGVVTTVEGLMAKISENLKCIHGFTYGDSLDDSRKNKWEDFRTKLHKLLNLEETWTLILDDALANSFVAPATDNLKDDDQLTFEEYERSWEQNEELGLNDMDTSSADAAYDLTSTTAVPQTEG